jgi:hypothetical protein
MSKKRRIFLNDPIIVESAPRQPTIIEGWGRPEVDEECRKKLKKYLLKTAVHCATEANEKMMLLFDRYGIDKNDLENRWYQLAFRLATEHEPGFKTVEIKKQGRPPEWDYISLAALYFEVELIKNERNKSAHKTGNYPACRILSQREPYKSKGLSLKRLVNLYNEAKKSPMVLAFKHTIKDSPETTVQEIERWFDGMRKIRDSIKPTRKA